MKANFRFFFPSFFPFILANISSQTSNPNSHESFRELMRVFSILPAIELFFYQQLPLILFTDSHANLHLPLIRLC